MIRHIHGPLTVNAKRVFRCYGFLFCLFFYCVSSALASPDIPIYVKSGTNLIKLTEQYCTSVYHWQEIARLNNLREPYLLKPGALINVPLELLKTEQVQAKVVSLSGEVFLVKGSTILGPVKKGDLINPGDTMVTGQNGFAHIVFPDQKYTRISSDSVFSLTYFVRVGDQGVKAEFFLEKGGITHSVRKHLLQTETFTTKTPVSVTGVRGTEFRVKMADAETNLVETLQGNVLVANSGAKVNVGGGEGTRVKKGQPPEQPRKLPPVPSLAGVADVYKILPVRISAPSATGVTKVRLRISRDADGTDVVADKIVSSGASFVFPTLADGKYFGVMTSLDKDQFESFPSSPFTFLLRTVPGPPMLSSPLNGKSVFENELILSWLKSQEADHYRVQLARDKDFSKITMEKDVKENTMQTPALLPGAYFFRVQAVAADGFRSLHSIADSWKKVAQLKLDKIDVSKTDAIDLRWPDLGPDITYDIQISRNSSFSDLVVDERGLKQAHFPIKKKLESTTYYLRIRGVLDDGQQSPWTPTQEMKIPPEPFNFMHAAVIAVLAALSIL